MHQEPQTCFTWAVEKKNWTDTQGSKVLFKLKIKFKFHLEINISGLEEGWRTTESTLLDVQCEVSSQRRFGLQGYLLVLVHCVF